MSSEKSRWPGVSSRFSTCPSCGKRSTVDVTEIPRCARAPSSPTWRRRRRALGADGAGLGELPAVEQELLGQRGLARVRVGDDRERAAARRLVQDPLRTRRDGGYVGHRGVSSSVSPVAARS